MGRGMKIFLGVIISFLVIITTYFYVSLYGLPFKKSSIAKDIRKHLEVKYEDDVELKGAVYNFKDGNYGGVYIIDDIEFYAEEGYGDHEYIDTYPDEVWAMQLKEDFQDIYRDLFPRAFEIDTNIVHNSETIVSGPEIPYYDEVHSMLSLDIQIDEPFTGSDDQWEAIAKIAIQVQEKSPYIDSTFLFIEEDQNRETFVTCPNKDTNVITSTDEAKKFCEQSVFTDVNK